MSFLKSIKFITITLCVALVLFMIITYTNTKAKLKAMEYENATLLHTLKKQNQAIEKLSLDIQTYKNQYIIESPNTKDLMGLFCQKCSKTRDLLKKQAI